MAIQSLIITVFSPCSLFTYKNLGYCWGFFKVHWRVGLCKASSVIIFNERDTWGSMNVYWSNIMAKQSISTHPKNLTFQKTKKCLFRQSKVIFVVVATIHFPCGISWNQVYNLMQNFVFITKIEKIEKVSYAQITTTGDFGILYVIGGFRGSFVSSERAERGKLF